MGCKRGRAECLTAVTNDGPPLTRRDDQMEHRCAMRRRVRARRSSASARPACRTATACPRNLPSARPCGPPQRNVSAGRESRGCGYGRDAPANHRLDLSPSRQFPRHWRSAITSFVMIAIHRDHGTPTERQALCKPSPGRGFGVSQCQSFNLAVVRSAFHVAIISEVRAFVRWCARIYDERQLLLMARPSASGAQTRHSSAGW